MKTATRPQYHRLQRILELIREGTRTGSLPNCGHFIRELEVSRRSLMRDLDFLRDDHHVPLPATTRVATRRVHAGGLPTRQRRRGRGYGFGMLIVQGWGRKPESRSLNLRRDARQPTQR